MELFATPAGSTHSSDAAEQIVQFGAQKAELEIRIRALAASRSVAQTATLTMTADHEKPSTSPKTGTAIVPEESVEEKSDAAIVLLGRATAHQ